MALDTPRFTHLTLWLGASAVFFYSLQRYPKFIRAEEPVPATDSQLPDQNQELSLQ